MFTAKIISKSKSNGFINVDVEFSKGEEIVNHSFTGIVEANQIDRNIERYLDILNKVDEELEKINIGEWQNPVKEEIKREPTAEEIAEREKAQKQMEIDALIAQIKREKEIEELAKENSELQALISKENVKSI